MAELLPEYKGVSPQDLVLYGTGAAWKECGTEIMMVGRIMSIRQEEGEVRVEVQPWRFQKQVHPKAWLYVETYLIGDIPFSAIQRKLKSLQAEEGEIVNSQWVKENESEKVLRGSGVVVHQYQEGKDGKLHPAAPEPFWWMWNEFDYRDPESALWTVPFVKECLWDWQVHPGSYGARNKNADQWNHVIRNIGPDTCPQGEWAVFDYPEERHKKWKMLINPQIADHCITRIQEFCQMSEDFDTAAEVYRWLKQVKEEGEEMVSKCKENRGRSLENESEEEDESQEGEEEGDESGEEDESQESEEEEEEEERTIGSSEEEELSDRETSEEEDESGRESDASSEETG